MTMAGHRPRGDRLVPDSFTGVLLLIAAILLLGLLIGFAIAALGPSQNPNVGGWVAGGAQALPR
jgi:hypothetical protein